ncbi:MAG: sensor domain-containing diguanylate cyclase [Ruminococcus sp.]|nr:sensor domain-containing diguanylate cyclase [Ruminococcus sp.]
MDFKQFADIFKPTTSIISVEKKPGGTYGDIRIVTGNDSYLDVATRFKALGVDKRELAEFVPNSLYDRYMKKDSNFEEYCYRSAVLGQTMHTYITPSNLPFWISVTMVPLQSDDENIGYCAYTQEFTKAAEADRMTNLSYDVLSQVLNTCIKLRGTGDFYSTINEVIRDIRDMCDADHCCILLSDFKQRKCSVLCEALSSDTELVSMHNYVDDKFFDIVQTWPATIGGGRCIIISKPQDWDSLKQQNPIWYESMTQAGAKSLVLFPLEYRDEIFGFIWAINFNTTMTPKIMDTLGLTTYFIASEIANYQLLDKLETMSTVDMLKGVSNRNEMNRRVDELCGDKAAAQCRVGIVFADLNGLKAVNDNQGHHAGDMLLQKAAQVLKEQFPECEIYRVGGDEFMLITTEMTQQVLEQRAASLREAAAKVENLAFSVGICAETADNVRKAMKEADARMYEDKQRFYSLYPERKRKD